VARTETASARECIRVGSVTCLEGALLQHGLQGDDDILLTGSAPTDQYKLQ
jgi:hypothetical protein